MQECIWVGTRKGLFAVKRFADGEWRIDAAHFLGDPVCMVLPDPRTGDVYAGLDLGHFGSKLHRSSDGGKSFEEITVPEYPPRPEDDDDVDPMRKTPLEWKLKMIWELAAGGADQPGRLWCGTLPGGLFRSDDRGDSWELTRSLWDLPERRRWFGGGMDQAGIHSVCVNPKDSRDVTVGISCGGVWRSFDDGGEWELRSHGMRAAFMPPDQSYDPVIQDPHRVVQCAAQPDHLWTQHHNGIFRSVDGGKDWSEITSVDPTFGFGTVVHPEDPETAWFVPAILDQKRYPKDARVIVTRTRDGGKSFDILTNGLPQEHAYDLVYRHSLDLDNSGQCLAFGSTTGSMWISEDQGDHWSSLSAHLPPIYCVRFG